MPKAIDKQEEACTIINKLISISQAQLEVVQSENYLPQTLLVMAEIQKSLLEELELLIS